MIDKPLSEQIEQADASEFVRFAYKIYDLLYPSDTEVYPNRPCLIDFEYFCNTESGHIAAAIMLARLMDVDHTNVTTQCNEAPSYSAVWGDSGIKYYSYCSTTKMAMLAAMYKKLESE